MDWIELVLVCIEHEKLVDRIPHTSCYAESTGLQDDCEIVHTKLSEEANRHRSYPVPNVECNQTRVWAG